MSPRADQYRVTHSKDNLADDYDEHAARPLPHSNGSHPGPAPYVKGKHARMKADARTMEVADLVLEYEAAVDARDPAAILDALLKMQQAGYVELARVKRRDCPIPLRIGEKA